jgi:hypothetical protein
MPRGNPQNLITMKDRSEEEVKKMQRKGGVNSGKARRNKALLRDCLQILMEKKVLDPESGKKITGAEALAVNMWYKALNEEDTAKAAKAFEVIRDTSGQKPVDKVEQTNTNIEIDFGDISED